MKKILFTLIAITTIFAGCGKENATNTGAAATTTVTSTINSEYSTAVEAVKAAINNNTFIYSTAVSYTVRYKTVSTYYTCQQESDELFGIDWLQYTTTSCSPESSTTSSVSFNATNNLANKKTELLNLISGAEVLSGNSYVNYSNQTISAIRIKKNNEIYVIDTSYPIGANPVVKEFRVTESGVEKVKMQYVERVN